MATQTLQQQLGDPSTWTLEPWAGFFAGNKINLPVCPVCGAAVWDAQAHYNWHVALGK